MKLPPFSVLPLVFVCVACGGTKPAEHAEAPAPQASSDSADPSPGASAPAAAEREKAAIPTACAGAGDFCAMPKEFVERLCQGVYPNLAFKLFAGGTPWTRGYATRKTQAWNAEGATLEGFVEFDEEVLLIASKMPPKGGMQVSGAGGYQAYRWNGSCVSLQSEEVTTSKPPSPKHPRIEWRYVEDGMREALRKDGAVNDAAVAQRKECKGVSVGDVSKKCVDADQKLGDAIVKFVSSGGATLPDPEKMP